MRVIVLIDIDPQHRHSGIDVITSRRRLRRGHPSSGKRYRDLIGAEICCATQSPDCQIGIRWAATVVGCSSDHRSIVLIKCYRGGTGSRGNPAALRVGRRHGREREAVYLYRMAVGGQRVDIGINDPIIFVADRPTDCRVVVLLFRI